MRHFLRHLPLPCYAPDPEPAGGGGAPAPAAPAEAPPAAEPGAAPAPAAEPAPPAAEPAPAVGDAPAPKADEPVDAHAEPTLLQQATEKPAEEKPAGEAPPAEPAKVEEPKPAEAPKVEEPAPPSEPVSAIVYDFKLPEGIKIEAGALKPATDLFNEMKIAPEQAQKVMDLHVSEMQKYADHLQQEQHRTFRTLRQQWRTEVMADQAIGGAGHKTAMAAIARVRDLGVPENEVAAFDHFLLATGAGDNPTFLRMMHRLSRFIDEPAIPSVQGNPPPNNGRAGKRTMADLYTKSFGRSS